MTCNGCGNTEATRTKTYSDGMEFCDQCGRVGTPWVPDVFWDGKEEHGLPDGPDGKPIVFGSKVEKAVYLKQKGLKESGDRVHGYYWTGSQIEPKKESAMKALQKVKQMGKDVRRREYLRIINENNHKA